MYLKGRANTDGTCWPAVRTTAGELHLSRATAGKRLAGQREPLSGQQEPYVKRIITASRNGRIPPPRGDSAVFLTPGGHQCDTPRRNHSKKELNTEKEKKFIAAFSLYLYIR
jgi:hypothetical protein